MSKPLALTAALLLLAGCNATDPTAPAPTALAPTRLAPAFLHGDTGCPEATTRTLGTPGEDGVTLGCSKGE